MRASEFIVEGNDQEFHTGGAKGLPFPGTYEQEYNMFKRKGPRRITAMTYEDASKETVTLKQIYKDNKPAHNERIWDYGTSVWDKPFEVKTIGPRKLDLFVSEQYGVEFIEDLFDRLEPEQHKMINQYIADPNLSNQIIVMDNGYIVDGNHRALAAALAKKPIKYIDINDEDEQLEEKWSAKYKRSINCKNPKGFSQRAHCQGRKKKQ